MSRSSEAAAHKPPEIGVTGVENSKLCMWWFLASEIMMFAGLIGSYVALKAANGVVVEESAAELNWRFATLNTFVLITSSATMALGVGSIKQGKAAQLRMFLLCTILLGCAFLGIKSMEYSQKFHHHIYPSTNIFFSCYFLLTGLHALHVIIGVILIAGVLLKSFSGKYSAIHHDTVENVGLYWHLVDVVWIFLFPLFYLV